MVWYWFWDDGSLQRAAMCHKVPDAWPAGSVLSVESDQNVESKTKNVESEIASLLQEINTLF